MNILANDIPIDLVDELLQRPGAYLMGQIGTQAAERQPDLLLPILAQEEFRRGSGRALQ